MNLKEAAMLFLILAVLAAGAALISTQIFAEPAPSASTPDQGSDGPMPTESDHGLGGAAAEGPGDTAIQGVQDHSAIWGPGVVEVTGDVLISPGIVITITPGTTIRMATSDGANLGADPNRIEYMVAGTLKVNGPATFTSQNAFPACGDWHGIRFLPDSGGHLKKAIVEWGVHGVQVNTTKPLYIADSTLRFNCEKAENVDASGAGLSILAGTHHIARTQVFGNSVETTGWSNSAVGAGVWLASGSTLFQDCSIHSNRAQSTEYDAIGGGMALWGDGVPIVRNCEIRHNTVAGTNRALGGGLAIDSTNAIIEADTFVHDNTITAMESGAYGGGISISSSQRATTPIIRSSRVMTNTCMAQSPTGCYGGGIGFAFGAAEASQNQAVISQNLIANNLSQGPRAQGGGIGLEHSTTAGLIDGNIIRNNLAQASGRGAQGGGICLTSENATRITNNLLHNNQAKDLGGQVAQGGGAYIEGIAAYAINNTIAGNEAAEGGGVYLADGAFHNNIVANNVASGDGGGIYWLGGSAGHNNAWGNSLNDYAEAGSPRPTTDVNANPLFLGTGLAPDLQQHSTEGAFPAEPSLAAPFRLQPDSPCIDAGSATIYGAPEIDIDHQARPQGRTYDIGFDEVPKPTLSVSKVALGSPVAGIPFSYSITVANSNTLLPAKGVTVTDTVPHGGRWVQGGMHDQGVVTLVFPTVPPQAKVSASWVVSSCQTELKNEWYRVTSSAEQVGSDWGPPETTQLSPPWLVPDFELSTDSVVQGEAVTLTEGSTTNGAPIVEWIWDLGDGTTGHGPSVTHTYGTADSYTVTLTITDTCGFSKTEVVPNAVVVAPGSGCTAVDRVDLALVTADEIYAGDKIEFEAEMLPEGNHELYRFRITTDGTQGFVVTSRENPLSFSQNFLDGGTHTLKVAVWNCNLTEQEAASDSLTVNVLPRALIYLPLLLK